MAAPRPLRVLLFSSNGSSTGHAVRVLAVGRAIERLARSRRLDVRLLLVTTSQADPLFGWAGLPTVRLPAPGAAARAGWAEAERLALLTETLRATVTAFAPDTLVTDTFPAGPHFELRTIVPEVRRRILIRRTIREDRFDEPELRAQLEDYDFVIVPGDPTPQPAHDLGARSERVAPITLLEPDECLSRPAARRALGLGRKKTVLLTAGGGPSAQTLARLQQAVPWLRRAGFATAFIAKGQLRAAAADAGLGSPVPLQRYLAAFDLAVATAGYNTAHELCARGIRSVLGSEEREFDDQAARARRFERAGLAVALPTWRRKTLLEAVERARALAPPTLEPSGAEQAARLVLGGAA